MVGVQSKDNVWHGLWVENEASYVDGLKKLINGFKIESR